MHTNHAHTHTHLLQLRYFENILLADPLIQQGKRKLILSLTHRTAVNTEVEKRVTNHTQGLKIAKR
jgi:hypothetical protein